MDTRRNAGLFSLIAGLLLAAVPVQASQTIGHSVKHRTQVVLPRGFAVLQQPARPRTISAPKRSTARVHARPSVAVVREGPLQRALDKVKLTAKERDQIAVLSAKADADGKATYGNRQLSPEQFQTLMAEIDTRYRKGIGDALTPQQHETFNRALSAPGKTDK